MISGTGSSSPEPGVTVPREDLRPLGLDAGRRLLSPWIDRLLDLLFPSRCAGCGRPGPVWCEACDGRLQRLEGLVCAQCGMPAHSPGRCRSPFEFPVRSYARYRGPMVRALLHLKYRDHGKQFKAMMTALVPRWRELEQASRHSTERRTGH